MPDRQQACFACRLPTAEAAPDWKTRRTAASPWFVRRDSSWPERFQEHDEHNAIHGDCWGEGGGGTDTTEGCRSNYLASTILCAVIIQVKNKPKQGGAGEDKFVSRHAGEGALSENGRLNGMLCTPDISLTLAASASCCATVCTIIIPTAIRTVRPVHALRQDAGGTRQVKGDIYNLHLEQTGSSAS
jgi:hypothetical protein